MDFSVFIKGQDPLIDFAPHRATRTVAKLVLELSLAVPVGQNAIKLVSDEPWKEIKRQARLGVRTVPKSSYIPEKMPPREIPNVYFQPPQSYTWRIQHHTVTFSAPA